MTKKKFKNALNSTNFTNLQNLEKQGKFPESVHSLGNRKKIKFFYQGPDNSWKVNLNKNMINKMNDYYKEDLKKFGYEI